MRVISLINEKGGVGKTTVATNLAAGLAIRGKRVVLIDTDPQGHSTLAFGLEKEPAFYDFIVRNAPLTSVMRLVNPEQYGMPGHEVMGRLLLIGANVEVRSVETNMSDAFAVLRRVTQLDQIADYVIFDTSPTPSQLHASIYMATDAILYPTRCEAWAFDGLSESLSHLEAFQPVREAYNLAPIELMGIIPVMVRAQTVEHSENLDGLKADFGDKVWPSLPNRIVWPECASFRRSIFNVAPEHPAAHEFWEIVDKVEDYHAIKA